MEITAELREKIYSLSPEKLRQFERFVDFLIEEVKKKNIIEEKFKSVDNERDKKV